MLRCQALSFLVVGKAKSGLHPILKIWAIASTSHDNSGTKFHRV